MGVPLLDLKAQYHTIESEIKEAIDEVLESQYFILGPKVSSLEEEVSVYSGCKYALGVSSGTDALLLALMALDISSGDIVITTPYTFFATAGSIARVGARPMFADIDKESYNISPESLEELLCSLSKNDLTKVKAVIPVHLFGQVADMSKIAVICEKYNLRIIEDSAQAIGAEYMYQGEVKKAGSIGDVGCLSFFPSKNLGGVGDGGMVLTNNEELFKKMKVLRVHGSSPKYYHKYVGGNFRLDEMQAAVLLVKLKYLDQWTQQRQMNAEKYHELLKHLEGDSLSLPKAVYKKRGIKNYHIYNQYCIRTTKRDELKLFLKEKGIDTEIYYPVPMHLQECFKYLEYAEGGFVNSERSAKESLALPVYPEISDTNIRYVAECIDMFFNKN